MRVTVKLFATLGEGRLPESSLDLETGTTIAGIMEKLGIPRRAVTLHFVNGRHADPGRVLEEGDSVALFPPVGGG